MAYSPTRNTRNYVPKRPNHRGASSSTRNTRNYVPQAVPQTTKGTLRGVQRTTAGLLVDQLVGSDPLENFDSRFSADTAGYPLDCTSP